MSDRAADVSAGCIDPTALPDLSPRAQSAHRMAATVTAAFAVAGMVWVFLTDVLLYGVSHNRALVARIETAKGWIFIALASLLLYAVCFRGAARLDRVRRLTSAVVESIADGILLLGPDHRIAHANPAAARMLGCGIDELVGMDAPQFSRRFRVSYPNGALVPPEQFVSQRVFDEGGPLHYKAILHVDHSSREVVISATAAGVRWTVGAPAVWVVSVMHDITASENLEHLRDRFFAAAAHSLKTPVAVVKADIQAMLPTIEPHHRRTAASIERQCDRIDRLIQNLLVLARAHSRTLQLHPRSIELGPLLERIAHERIWSYRHDVQTDVAAPPALHADQERLALAIRNLMYEATRMSAADSRLTLVARPEGNRVAVGVRYQPAPWLTRDTGADGEYDDIGIGRSVAETIVEKHGGSLSEEATGEEMTRWIHLPADVGACA